MGSLRIYNAPSIGDLACRFASRVARNALPGRAVVQTFLKLNEFAGRDDIDAVINDFVEVCDWEIKHQCSGIIESSRGMIEAVQKNKSSLVLPDDGLDKHCYADFQTLEFDIAYGEIELAMGFLSKLDLRDFLPHQIPLIRTVASDNIAALKLKYKDAIDGDKLGQYVRQRDKMLQKFGIVVNSRNRKAIISDVREVIGLAEMPVRLSYNFYDEVHASVVQELEECVIESLECEVNSVIRIDSSFGESLCEETIDVRLYSQAAYNF